MADQLKGKRVAALATHGFEQDELLQPRKALIDAGAAVDVVSPESGRIRGWKHKEWGDEVKVDRTLEQARADEYDALLLPGGVMNPDRLRMDPRAVQFVKRFFDDGKPIAVICHGPWTLVEADVVRGVTMTSWPSVKMDLQKRRSKMGGSGGRRRSWHRLVAEAGRHSRVQPENDRGIRRRRPRRRGTPRDGRDTYIIGECESEFSGRASSRAHSRLVF
jgi:protease I